jgi:hypothetical protein
VIVEISVVRRDFLLLGVNMLGHGYAADLSRVAFLLNNISPAFIWQRVTFIFRRRRYLKTGKLGLNLAIEQNLFPFAADTLIFDLRHAVANGGCEDLVISAERDFKGLLNNVVAVRVLDKVCKLFGVANFDYKFRARLRIAPLEANFNHV